MRASERSLRSHRAKVAAENLLREFGITEPQEIALEHLAMARNVIVHPGALSGLEARLVRVGDRGKIRVSDAIREPGRYRFSVAHELGHWELHRQRTQMTLSECTSIQVSPGYRGDGTELEANCFASELLMPEFMFRPRCSGPMSLHLAAQLARTFDASLTASAIRLITLRDDYAAVIYTVEGLIKWFWPSQNFEYAWIERTQELLAPSPAAKYWKRGQEPPQDPVQIPPYTWLSDDFIGDSIYEHSIPMPTYNAVLTLIWVDD